MMVHADYQHVFSTDGQSKAKGTPHLVRHSKLLASLGQFMPDGALHVRVQLKVFLDDSVLAAFRGCHCHVPRPADASAVSQAQGDDLVAMVRSACMQVSCHTCSEPPLLTRQASGSTLSTGISCPR